MPTQNTPTPPVFKVHSPKLQKAAVSFVMSVYPYVCPHCTTHFPL